MRGNDEAVEQASAKILDLHSELSVRGFEMRWFVERPAATVEPRRHRVHQLGGGTVGTPSHS